jgi:DNA-binding MarR family transcriptional regulator
MQREGAMSRNEVSGNRYVQDQVARAVGEHKELDPSLLALTLTLYRTMAAFDRASQAELSPHDLTAIQFNILTVLHRADDAVTMRELGRAISVRPTNLTHLVDTLAERQLIERRLNMADRRSYFVGITPIGERFLAEFLPNHWRYKQRLMSGLSREERLELTRLLERLEQSVADALKLDGTRESSPVSRQRLKKSG